MDVRFAGQPWNGGTNLDDFLHECSATDAPQLFRCAVAWAKRSGLEPALPHLTELRRRGARTEIILGISEGGATRQGLELAAAVFDVAYVYHDVSGRTYHPKAYCLESREGVEIFVGSHNLTAGGLYYNYEAAVHVTLSKQDDDLTIFEDFELWWKRLVTEEGLVRRLDASLIRELVDEQDFRIGDEDEARRARRSGAGDVDVDSVTDDDPDETEPVFARSSTPKRGPRHPARRSSVLATATGASVRRTAGTDGSASGATPSTTGSDVVTLSWWKQMKGSDAQQPPSTASQPTGALRLGSAGFPIDKETWFRQDFFGDRAWGPDPYKPSLEFTEIAARVHIDGRDLGDMSFRVDHSPGRASGQNNVTTVLKWGPLNATLRSRSRVGHWVRLSKRVDGTFLIAITEQRPEA